MCGRLTRKRVLRLEGRDLDAAVAEHVFGLRPCIPTEEHDHPSGCYPIVDGPPRYSDDIATAWQVVEHLRDRFGYGLRLEYDWGDPHAWAHIGPINGPGWDAFGEKPSVAICRAALLAVVGEGGDG